MSIKREFKITATCDFCGTEFDPSESYPRGEKGDFGIFGLALTLRVRTGIPEIVQVFGEDSPKMGYAEGHMCQKCFESITQKIGFNKAQKEKN